jgi:hypothetical protein
VGGTTGHLASWGLGEQSGPQTPLFRSFFTEIPLSIPCRLPLLAHFPSPPLSLSLAVSRLPPSPWLRLLLLKFHNQQESEQGEGGWSH